MSAQDFEREWWGGCANTFHEEQKQLVYALHMGLRANWNVAHPPEFDLGGKRILDIGGGPVSLLLKTARNEGRTVVDPCQFPSWVDDRYHACGISYIDMRAEDLTWPVADMYDEAWCYNVLQHVDDPEKVAANMRIAAPFMRVFEWIDLPAYEGHPHTLTEADLNRWFGRTGSVLQVCDSGAVGRAWVVSS